MDKKVIETKDEMEIDLQQLFGLLLKKSWLIGLLAVVCAVAVFFGTFFFIAPKYQSSVMFYVNNSAVSKGNSANISTGDISASRGLVKSYIIIMETRETIDEVIKYAGVDRTYGQVKGMIEAKAVDDTELLKIVVTSKDPVEAEKIASAISVVLPSRIDSILEGTSSKIVEEAVIPTKPSSPNYTKNALIGFIFGLLATSALIVLQELFNVSVRSEDDISRATNLPLLTNVPDLTVKTSAYYGYKKPAGYVKNNLEADETPELVGEKINFAASEAYKLLRTKLQFSFTDQKSCHVIGVTSTIAGEGKSITSANLAYTLSQFGSRVLLIDCDMRCPSVFKKLPVKKAPGLSDFLSGQAASNAIVQPCGLKSDVNAFHVISAGRIPPNPMQLISSARMAETIEVLRNNYDFIILDLPPVGEVGDALAIAKQTDGVLLVVRQRFATRPALVNAVRQFDFVNSRILGIVYNCVPEDSNKKKYRK